MDASLFDLAAIQQAVQQAACGIIICDADKRPWLINAEARRRAPCVQQGRTVRVIACHSNAPPTEAEPVLPENDILARALSGETMVGRQAAIASHDDTFCGAVVSAAPVRDDDRRIIGAILLLSDVATCKRPEFASGLVGRVVTQSGDAISIVGPDYRYRFVNPAYSVRTGIPVERIVGSHVAEVMGHETFETVVKPQLDRCLDGEEIAYETWFNLQAMGRRCLAVQYSPLKTDTGEIEGVVVISRDVTERALAEEALRKAEERLRLTLEAAEAGAWEWDVRTGQSVWSDENYRILGFEPGGVPACYAKWLTAVHPEDRAAAQRKRAQALAAGSELNMEYRVVWPDGCIRWIQNIARVRRDDTGNAIGLIGIALDITDRKRIEEELRLSHERFRTALANAPIIVFNQDTSLRYTWVYNAEPDIPLDGILGRTDAEILGEDAAREVTDVKASVLTTGIGIRREANLQFPQGMQTYDLTAEPLRDPKGRVIGITCAAVNITQRKKAEDDLRRSEGNFRRTFDQAPIGAAMVSLDYRFLRVNAELCRITGYGEDELLAIGFPDITHPDDLKTDVDNARRVLAGEIDQYTMEKRYIRKDGGIVWINLHVRLIRDPSGRPLYFLPMMEDIGGRKLAEEALRAAKAQAEWANAAKTRFLAAASHDLRQPLQAQVLFQTLLAKSNRDPALAPLVERMGRTIDAQQDMLNTLLDISRLDAGIIEVKKSDVPIAGILDRLTEEFRLQAERRGLRLRTVRCKAVIHSDPGLLDRILRNLVSNAVKYTNAGRVLLGCRRQGSSLRVQVWDTGMGIAEAHLTEIFREFNQLGKPTGDGAMGLGLGLAIVDRLSRLLGYRVIVRSAPGRGSMFEIVDIPLGQPIAAPSAEINVVHPMTSPHRALIVVIEDDPQLLDALCMALEAAGYHVVGAECADRAVKRLQAEGRLPDVVVTDYRLGGGTTGIDALRRLSNATGHTIPGIVLTGDTSPNRLREVKGSGMELLHKPVKAETLIDTIEELLARRGQ